jgi:hypothetical protein
MSKTNDLKMGEEGERYVKPILEEYFKTDLTKNEKYCLVDFENEDMVVEVKTRRANKSTYPDIFIPYYKLDYVKDTDKTFYACFNLYDGVYIFNITEHLDICEIREGGRTDRGKDEKSDMILCPTKLFVKIN